jgi:hypothetical protein
MVGRFQRQPCKAWGACLALAALAAGSALGQTSTDPFALEDALNAPDWLKLEGETRVRYETLEGQFRAGGKGGDQLLAFRTLILAEADSGPLAAGVEIQDSRVYLDDAGTPLTTSIVNPLDVLQAYVRLDLDGAFGSKTAFLKLGRQTVDIGSRRILERVEMANVIFSYTGAYWRSTNDRGDQLHLLHVSPTNRLPNQRDALGDNNISGDEEDWGRRFYGAHYMRANVLGDWLPDVSAEAFVYSLKERDTRAVPTPNRDYLQPGFRIVRPPRQGRFDFDIEAAWRSGTRRETTAESDVRDLTVDARMVYAHIAYTFSHAWRPRLAIDYYLATGDESPQDGAYNQFERLFGSRRSDLGNTGIHGPLTPANIDAPGARIEITPSPRFDLRLAWKSAYLDEQKDAWVQARVRDPLGLSGDFIGDAFEVRSRYWVIPGSLRAELGGSALLGGEFADRAPNAARQGDTWFGYVQLVQSF